MKVTKNALRVLPHVAVLVGLIVSTNASAQNYASAHKGKQCNAGYTGTWIIGDACDLGGNTNIKTNDAIDIQCDANSGQWSVDFYQEPANADPNGASQAERLAVCPGNGFITKAEGGRLRLQCNFWESVNNVVKQLEFKLEPVATANIVNMSWLTRDQDDPNVVCNVAGRPEGGEGTGSAGQTINDS